MSDRLRKMKQEEEKVLARDQDRLDALIMQMIKVRLRVEKRKRNLARWERRLTAPQLPKKELEPPPAVPAQSIPNDVDGDGIPDFLRRDKEAADKLRTEIAEQKKAKARGRVARMKAKLSGETKRMPLSGKAALDYIRQG